MGNCKCSSQKVPIQTQKLSQEEWEAKLNEHYQSILNSCDGTLNCSCNIIKQEQNGKLIFQIQGSLIEQLKTIK
ncbi:unnamed protein product [Paramecium pentaurelia]|uniref:Uncharacterized protein n=1 Tax=Paramecium pentaurelia TaxID=43138 RepID=A0A8S1VEK5_9CILI|nr:unnamed protein product [Paramecium pentaurelia]